MYTMNAIAAAFDYSNRKSYIPVTVPPIGLTAIGNANS